MEGCAFLGGGVLYMVVLYMGVCHCDDSYYCVLEMSSGKAPVMKVAINWRSYSAGK